MKLYEKRGKLQRSAEEVAGAVINTLSLPRLPHSPFFRPQPRQPQEALRAPTHPFKICSRDSSIHSCALYAMGVFETDPISLYPRIPDPPLPTPEAS